MARKDLLKNVMASSSEQPKDSGRSGYAMRGASKSMKVSIDNLAENSKRLLEGETIVEIDPQLIDVSFISDRLSDDDEDGGVNDGGMDFKGKGDIFEVAWNKEETRVASCFSSNVVEVIDFEP